MTTGHQHRGEQCVSLVVNTLGLVWVVMPGPYWPTTHTYPPGLSHPLGSTIPSLSYSTTRSLCSLLPIDHSLTLGKFPPAA